MNTLLPFFGVIRVTGDDRHEFLHNQFSNDIKNLSDKTACYATYNTPKGRVIANMLAYCADDAVFLILAADLAEKVAKQSANGGFGRLGCCRLPAGKCVGGVSERTETAIIV